MDDHLVLVSAIEDHDGVLGSDYVYAAWGEEFAMAHSRWFPSLKPPKLMLNLGPSLADYLINNHLTAFIPYRVADDYVAEGKLHFVKGAPEFPYPSYAVWTQNKPQDLLDAALTELRQAAKDAPWISLA